MKQIVANLLKVGLLKCEVDENNLLPETEISLNPLYEK